MKIKTEPPDGQSGGSGSKKSPEKEKKSKTPKQETSVRVKSEPCDRPVKKETTAPASVAARKQQSVSDLTTHVIKSEVKLEIATNATTSSTVRKRNVKRKKKVTRRKSTTKRKVTKKKTVRKIGRKKVRKAKAVTRSSRGIVSDVRARLAAKIGLTKKKSLGPHSLPLINKPTYELTPLRSDLLPTLSLLGQGLPVTISVPVGDEFDEIADFGDVTAVTSRRSHFSSSRLTDLKAGLIPDPLEEIRLNSDLLGSILERQDVLLARSQDIVVSYDGTLKLNSSHAAVRRHTSTTNDAGDQKAHKSPPSSDSNSNGHHASDHTNNREIDPESNNPISNSSHLSNGKEQSENVTLVRSSLPACGMPLKKRKFESHDNLNETADSKLPLPPIERLHLTEVKSEPVTEASAGIDPETRESLVAKANKEADSVSSSASLAASESTSATPSANDCVHDKKSIEVKLELETSETRVKEEPPASSSCNEVEVGSQTAKKVKRCRHGKVVRDKSSKVTKSDNHHHRRDESREKAEKDESASKARTDSHSKSNGADETKRRVSVRSEVRDKSSSEKRRSEDREKSHRIHRKKNDEAWMENTDRRSHHSRERDADRDRSRSGRRPSRSREPASESGSRRSSRHEEEKGTRKGSHNFERYDDDLPMEHERSRKHRHHHLRMSDRQHKEDAKPVVKENISDRDLPHMDSSLASDSKSMHSKSKPAYDKVGGEGFRHVNSSESRNHMASRRMSGPKTPPDVRMKYLNASVNNKSPPTPTMDEADGPAVTSANGSMTHHPVSRRPVSSRNAVHEKAPQPDVPLFASPTKVTTNVSSWLKQFTRSDASSRTSHHVPASASVSREAEGEKELDSGTNQVAIQQFLQSMLPKSKSAASPVSDTAYSPGGPLTDSPHRSDVASASRPTSANQSLIDQILKFAQQTQLSSTSASLAESSSSAQKLSASGTSADDVSSKEKYLDKLNRQERVVEEVKLVLKPFYQRREVTKFEYKEIMRKAVPKVCHNKTQEINPSKIKGLVEKYIRQVKADRQK